MKKQDKYNIDDDLLRRYLSNDLSTEESENLQQDAEADPLIRQYLDQMETIWQSSGNIGAIDSIDFEGDWNSIRQKFNATESVTRTKDPVTKETDSATRATDTPAEATESVTGTKDPVTKATDSADGTAKAHVRTLTFRITRVAAIFVLACLTAFTLYYFTGKGPMTKTQWITMDTGETQQEIILPDGTVVALNSGSSLVYPSQFKKGNRMVMLEGEAYFDVARDEARAFIIDVAGETAVEVLGTSFNIRQDPRTNKVFLNVLTGKVAFYPKEKKKEAKVLEKNQQAVYQNGTVTQSASFDLNFLSWKTRTLQFENTPFPEVVEQLGRHYNTKFMLTDNRLDTITLTGIYKNQNIEDVLEEIGLVLELEFTSEQGTIIVRSYD